jgi:hypothetical protein
MKVEINNRKEIGKFENICPQFTPNDQRGNQKLKIEKYL